MRHHLDRQTAFEELLLVEVVHRRRFRGDERLIERVVFVLGQRAIQIVALPIIDAARGQARRTRTVHRTLAHLSHPPRTRPAYPRSHRDARNTFDRSIVSASTIGLIAS